MSKVHAAITGVQGYVPEDILSNEDLAKIVDTSDEWITTRTGIKERRVMKNGASSKSTSGLRVHSRPTPSISSNNSIYITN